jgi:hypothetical protein
VEQQNSDLSHLEGPCCFAVRKRVLSDAERDEDQELGNLSSEGSASLGPEYQEFVMCPQRRNIGNPTVEISQ